MILVGSYEHFEETCRFRFYLFDFVCHHLFLSTFKYELYFASQFFFLTCERSLYLSLLASRFRNDHYHFCSYSVL
jgi:hypothetical protein